MTMVKIRSLFMGLSLAAIAQSVSATSPPNPDIADPSSTIHLPLYNSR
jgi:hypothetical protein